MQNPTHNDHPINALLQSRYSPRAYTDQPIDRETMLSLFEAARWAPSSRNAQPWRFIIATKDNPEAYEKMFSILKEGNQKWAGSAYMLMLVIAATEGNGSAYYDAGQAVAHLTVQATEHGLGIRQMGGIYVDRATELYQVPEGYEVLNAMAIGYPAKPETLPEDLQRRERAPRHRQPLSDFVFDAWGEPASVLDEEVIPAGK